MLKLTIKMSSERESDLAGMLREIAVRINDGEYQRREVIAAGTYEFELVAESKPPHVVECTAFSVEAPDGDSWTGVVDETGDIVQVQLYAHGAYRNFESEYYHLAGWCAEYGFTLREKKFELELILDN